MGMYLEILEAASKTISMPDALMVPKQLVRPNSHAVARIVNLWTADQRERFEERAAIREFDGDMERSAAERAALADCSRLRSQGELETPFRDSPERSKGRE